MVIFTFKPRLSLNLCKVSSIVAYIFSFRNTLFSNFIVFRKPGKLLPQFCTNYRKDRCEVRQTKMVVIPPNWNAVFYWTRACHVAGVKTSWRPRANKTSWRPRTQKRGKFVNKIQTRPVRKSFFEIMATKRFHVRSEEEIEQLIRDKSSKSTNKATLNAVKTLREFCAQENSNENFEELNKEDLNSLLRKFFASARKADGSHYSKNSLLGIRYGISRYLQQEKGWKLTEDEAFTSANEAFSTVSWCNFACQH